MKLAVSVNISESFTQHGVIANASSILFTQVFSDQAPPTRKALGTASLPRGVAVELDAVFATTA